MSSCLFEPDAVRAIGRPIAEPIAEPISEPISEPIVEPIAGTCATWVSDGEIAQTRSTLPRRRRTERKGPLWILDA
jgi:hypothetical protein